LSIVSVVGEIATRLRIGTGSLRTAIMFPWIDRSSRRPAINRILGGFDDAAFVAVLATLRINALRGMNDARWFDPRLARPNSSISNEWKVPAQAWLSARKISAAIIRWARHWCARWTGSRLTFGLENLWRCSEPRDLVSRHCLIWLPGLTGPRPGP